MANYCGNDNPDGIIVWTIIVIGPCYYYCVDRQTDSPWTSGQTVDRQLMADENGRTEEDG